MAIQIQGNGGTVQEVETNTRAARVAIRPIDVGALGSYSISQVSGDIAAGAQTLQPVYSFRWGNASNLALVKLVAASLNSHGTGFAAGLGVLDCIIARSFSVNDTGTGSTAATTTGNNCKMRTSFGTTLVTDSRIAGTAVLTAGTRTLDTQPIGQVNFNITTTTNTTHQATTVLWGPGGLGSAGPPSGNWPLVLAQNEGFVVRATVPATGVWNVVVTVQWDEVASY